MKQEDLFLAIAAVEDDWLLQSEDYIANHVIFVPKSRKQLSKAILVAVITVAMLALTACTAIGFLYYDSPLEILETFFGTNTKYLQRDAWYVGNMRLGQTYFAGFERIPIDEKVAESLEKKIYPVGQSITWNGYTLIVYGYLYDSTTGCGFISYAIESSDDENISQFYRIQPNGALYCRDGELISASQVRKDYIVKGKSNEQKLVVASFFYNSERVTELELKLSFGTYMTTDDFMKFIEDEQRKMHMSSNKNITKEDMAEVFQKWDDMKETSPDSIRINLETGALLDYIQTDNGAIQISPMALSINRQFSDVFDNNVKEIVITYNDGSEFVVLSHDTENFFLHYDKSDSSEICYLFNRLIDVNKISSVSINGLTFVI